MPTYEYECQKCRCTFEEFQRMSDKPVRTCPKCKGKVIRLISGGTGLIFKGSGFYITDYARKKSGSSDSGRAADEQSAKSSSGQARAVADPAKSSSSDKDKKDSAKKDS